MKFKLAERPLFVVMIVIKKNDFFGFLIHGDALIVLNFSLSFYCDCNEDWINVLGCILLGDSGFNCHSFLLNGR